MPLEIQKAMNYTLLGPQKTFWFLDDILLVSKDTEDKHKKYIFDCRPRPAEKNIRINLLKCLMQI